MFASIWIATCAFLLIFMDNCCGVNLNSTTSYPTTVSQDESNDDDISPTQESFQVPAASAPEFDALNGTVFVISATLHVQSATEGAKVYYTIDGSYPDPLTALMAESSEPVILTEPATYTLKAIAVCSDLADSPVTVLMVTVLARVAKPILTPSPQPSDTFERSVTITFGCDTQTATLWYTTDGMAPEPNGDSCFSVSPGDSVVWSGIGTTVIRVRASAPGMADSALVQAIYTVVMPAFDTHPFARGSGQEDPGPQIHSFAIPVSKESGAKSLQKTALQSPEQDSTTVYGKLALLADPDLFSFVVPNKGFGSLDLMTTIAKSSQEQPAIIDQTQSGLSPTCEVAVPASFFNPTTGACEGNLVSQGQVLQAITTSNVNFGIRNNSFVVGQLSKEVIESTENKFEELVSGVGWLVRQGQSYIATNLQEADLSPIDALFGNGFDSDKSRFEAFTATGHRSAIGASHDGRLMLVTVDGGQGYTLGQFADALVELGAYQAINLVGHAAAAFAVHGMLVTTPSGSCSESQDYLRCEQPVSAVACIHGKGSINSVTTLNPTFTPSSAGFAASTEGPQKPTEDLSADCATLIPHQDHTDTSTKTAAPTLNTTLEKADDHADLDMETLCLPFSSSNDKLKTALAVAIMLFLVSLAANISGSLRRKLTDAQTKQAYVRHQEMRLPGHQKAGGLRGLTRLGAEDGEEEVEYKLYGDTPDNSRERRGPKGAKGKLKSMIKTVQGKVTRRPSPDDGMKEIDLEINPFEASSYSRIPTIQRSESQGSLQI